MTLPSWHPDAFAARRPFLEKRRAIVQATRKWFDDNGFAEVETPSLQISPGMEPHLKAFETRMNEPFSPSGASMYLHTSPEFAMKKLLAAGMPRIFQLARCFRNEERSPTHHPEFTMLEWYRAGEDLNVLMDDCVGLLRTALQASDEKLFVWHGQSCDPNRPARILTVCEAFQEYAGISLEPLIDESDDPEPAPFRRQAQAIGLACQDTDRWEDVFFRVFLEKIEPNLGLGSPTFLTEYPVCMAALAKQLPKDKRFSQRFELYVCGLELANAFGELTDSREQARRFQRDQELKMRLYGHTYPIDGDFLNALNLMPECSGIALGFDRLAMLATHAPHIDQVLWLPVTRV